MNTMPIEPQTAIIMEKVNKHYGAYHALRDIDFVVGTGERVVLCGPSGSGKSTLVRCINRLEVIQSGRIVVDGVDLGGGRHNVEQVRRDVGMVFQQFNLFPHMTVIQNCMLAPMRVRGLSAEEARVVAQRLLDRVQIGAVDVDDPQIDAELCCRPRVVVLCGMVGVDETDGVFHSAS